MRTVDSDAKNTPVRRPGAPTKRAPAAPARRPPLPDKSTRRAPTRDLPAGRVTRTYRWFASRPQERVPWAIGPALYASGGLAHLWDPPFWEVGGVGAAFAFGTYSTVKRRTGDEVKAGKAAAAVGAAGGWLGMAADFGLTAGPHALMSAAYWGLYALAYGVYRLDEGTRKKIGKRKTAEQWARIIPLWGLVGPNGSAVLRSERETRLGFHLLVDTRPTGKRASEFTSGNRLCETIAEYFRLPEGRVTVSRHRIAGAVEISVRIDDPWKHTIPHPLLDEGAEIELPETHDVRHPLIVGMDPETGRPLKIAVWDESGAGHMLIVGIKGSGKTVLVNNILERLTASDNVFTVLIDVSKGKDGMRWRDKGALGMSALGPGEVVKALKILKTMAAAVSYRAAMNPDPVFIPRPGHPLIEIVIDEIDKLFKLRPDLAPQFQKALSIITSTSRSEGIGLIIVGQRGTAQWIGGADVRANIDRFAVGKTQRATEAANALGEFGFEMPNMRKYGEGHKGVMALVHDEDVQLGRTFCLREFADIEYLAEGRIPAPLEPGLVEWMGDKYAELVDASAADTPVVMTKAAGTASMAPPSLDALDAEMEAALPKDLEGWKDEMDQRGNAVRDRLNSVAEQLAELPEVDPERLAAAREERRRQQDEQTIIDPAHRAAVMALLADGPATMSQIRDAVGLADLPGTGADIRKRNGTRRQAALRMMKRLRDLEGVVGSEGKGGAARWFLVDPGARTDGDENGDAE